MRVVEARRAFRQSRDTLTELFRESLGRDQSGVKGMPRRTVNMIFYFVQHEAHHRGQICRLAKALGHEFSTMAEIGAATGVEFLPDGQVLAAAEPARRGGGAAAVVKPSQ